MGAGVPAAEVEQLAAALSRPLGAGVDEERPGLQLAAGVRRAAQVVVGEAAVGEEERAADGLVATQREATPRRSPSPSARAR
jgi:hypothetical protein